MNVRFLLILSLLLASCSSLPEIRPSADVTGKMSACPSPFVVQKTRFIHAIEAAMAGETRAVMIGVTVADPAARTLSCALLSPEGLVFFEASRTSIGTQISRALPPFDKVDVARGLMDDIELIFLSRRRQSTGRAFSTRARPSAGAVCTMEGGWISEKPRTDASSSNATRKAADFNAVWRSRQAPILMPPSIFRRSNGPGILCP